MFIITILGKSGRDKNSNEPTTAHYSKDESLELPLKTGEFLNSTHCLFESFEDASLTLIATQEAFEFQQRLFTQASPKSAERLNHCDFKPLSSENEFEEIFHQILEAIKKVPKDKKIILDITHGFRHQPIIASFASVLGQINFKKSVQIIFAKSTDSKHSSTANISNESTNADSTNANTTDTKNSNTQNFCYVSLQRYAEISLISLALNSFVSTLTLPELPLNPKKNLLRKLETLCAALHANTPNLRHLNEALTALDEAKNSPSFKGLDNILAKTEQLLSNLKRILSREKECEKFRDFAEFMFEMGFYLIAATYISEGLGHFMLEKFKNAGLLKNNNADLYDKIQAAKDLVYCLCTPNKQVKKETKECLKVEQARQRVTETRKMGDFQRMKSAMADISRLRNALVHLNSNQQNMQAIRTELLTILNTFKGFFAPNFLQGF